jgi:hypothetical protein
MTTDRCEAVSPGGVQCGLPSGHEGQHQNGPQCKPWDAEPEPAGLYETREP